MPPSSDQPGQESLLNLDPYLQEGSSRKRSPKGKKGRKRKDESPEENAGKEKETTGSGGGGAGVPNGMTQPSSILAQLHKANPPAATAPAPSNHISAPFLEAWDAAPPSQYSATPQQETTNWASSIPYGRSPPETRSNGVSIAGSPPAPGAYNPGPPESLVGGFSHAHTSPPISPRAAYRQPVRPNTDYQSFGDYLGSSPNSRRLLSMYSQHTQHQPPLPHHPQAHFYGAPELDFGVSRTRDMARLAGEGWCCKFDIVPSTGPEGPGNSEDVLLVGFERGLDVFHVDKKRFDRIGRLAGLRGSVVGSKIIPSPSGHEELRAADPLVAVVVHGPYYPEPGPGKAQEGNDEFDPSGSMAQALQTADQTPDPNLYETTVEIYSLRNGTHIQTLFRSPKVEVEIRQYGPPTIPLPFGDLNIEAKGRFIVVSSGKSGEVYIFESRSVENVTVPFRCIGKTWTQTNQRLARSVSVSSTGSESSGLHEGSASERRQSPRANLSLSSRWLAVVPPASSTQTTLHGIVVSEGPINKIHGVSSHTSPSEPQVTCQLDTPDAESYLNKVARDASQTLLKGARWVGDQGMQAWKSYWTPEESQKLESSPPMAPPQNQQFFPPTHAQDSKPRTTKNHTTLVSMLDLERLSKSQNQKAAVALQPLATFSLPNGCSLVSFSPDGLKLLTASAKGDVQQVWDLMRMVHGETGRLRDHSTLLKGPTVREVARFPRMTEAKIIDVVWTEPRGARLAILTGKGTAHIYDLPPSAFQWPPPRHVVRKASTSAKPTESTDEDAPRPQTASSSLSSAFGMLSTTTTATLAAVRGRRPSSTSTFPTLGGFAGAGAQGGKAVAAGVNRSVSAAAVGAYSTLRHLGENRIALLVSQTELITPGCVHWLHGKDVTNTLATTAGGLVRIYGISRSSSSSSSKSTNNRRPSVLAGKPAEFSIPKDSTSPRDTIPRARHTQINNGDDETHPPPGSFWRFSPSPVPSTRPRPVRNQDTHPLSHAEIDTSPAYQPFHTDRRVNFYVYDHDPTVQDPHHLHFPTAATAKATTSTWLFGEPIPVTKVSSGNVGHDNDDDDDDDDDDECGGGRGGGGGGGDRGRGEMENVVSVEGEGGQIVVMTTRRRRGGKRGGVGRDGEGEGGAEGEEDIFEDDCEVVDFAEERV